MSIRERGIYLKFENFVAYAKFNFNFKCLENIDKNFDQIYELVKNNIVKKITRTYLMLFSFEQNESYLFAIHLKESHQRKLLTMI